MDPSRRIQVYIVTLFIEPGAELRGRVRLVQNDDDALFTGEHELLNLLRQAVAAPPMAAEAPEPPFPDLSGGRADTEPSLGHASGSGP
jgi:hypothetical protein